MNNELLDIVTEIKAIEAYFIKIKLYFLYKFRSTRRLHFYFQEFFCIKSEPFFQGTRRLHIFHFEFSHFSLNKSHSTAKSGTWFFFYIIFISNKLPLLCIIKLKRTTIFMSFCVCINKQLAFFLSIKEKRRKENLICILKFYRMIKQEKKILAKIA